MLKGQKYIAEGIVMNWMFVTHSPNSYVHILTPGVKILGGGASGRWLGHEDGETSWVRLVF